MPVLSNKFRVAVYDEFLDSFAALPRAQQKKVSRFMRTFRANPTATGLNYETINNSADSNLRSVRIDQAYRAIVLKPEKGNVYVLLWVDHHDKAYAWADKKRIVIHPETGSLQVLSSVPSEELSAAVEAVPVAAKKKAQPIFKSYSDEELVSVGIPQGYLPLVRELVSKEQLDAASSSLPSDMYEALFFLADGETIATVREALGLEASKEEVDTEDFETALDNVGTMRHFALVTDDQDLEAMLDAPLDKWRVFLHPSQRKLVTKNYNGPARVLGGAGTGKTVVAMHRAKHLATQVFTGENDRILFTTFTNNLAKDIQENLRKLCSPATMRRIEVVHLDKWVRNFLKAQGYDYRIVYFPRAPLKGFWDQALAIRPDGFSEDFFREEWDHVIQPNGCASYEEYRSAKRVGRGKRLSRSQRKEIWPVFEEYRNLLDAKGLRESVDAMRDAAGLLETKKSHTPYRSVIIDESQDMSTVAFNLLRRLIPVEQPNDLFIVGDGHQRIYRRKVVLSHAGVKIVGRSKKLYINYRTTDEIRKYAVALLEDIAVDDLDGGIDTNSKYKSLFHGQPPQVKTFKTFKQEVAAIKAFAKADDISQTCLVARTNPLVAQYEEALEAAGIETHRLKRSEAENATAPGLRIATMHRVKGLEFDRLIVAGANKGIVPLNVGDMKSDDDAVREEAEQRERALFYVAVTRARRDVLITSHGKPSPWLKENN